MVLKCEMLIWLKIAFCTMGPVGWFIFVSLSVGEKFIDNEVPLGAYFMAISMLVFTTACWVYVGASNWWC